MEQTALSGLVTDLGSPDPAVRDDGAYSTLAEAVLSDQLDEQQRRWLGSQLVQALSHPEPQARAFAPLGLALLPSRGTWDSDWTQPLLDWWANEEDLRGYDEQLGWLHAVAHGADALGELGAHHIVAAELLLETVARRLVTPTSYVWRDQEEDRVAGAVLEILAAGQGDHPAGPPPSDRPMSTGSATSMSWLTPVRELLVAGAPGPVPPHVTNTLHTLRSLYVALGQRSGDGDQQLPAVPGAATLQVELARVLQPATSWLWTQ